MNCIHIPGSNQVLYDGSIVILANYHNTKWIVHEGWYTYNGKQCHGWYFCEIPSQTILPVNEDDLKTLTIVDNGCGCPPGPPMPPMPDRPFTPQMAWELDRAWISVPTIAHRDNLNKRFLPDGKIVRVDEVTPGVPGYFRWDQVSQTWVDETFGIDVIVPTLPFPRMKLADVYSELEKRYGFKIYFYVVFPCKCWYSYIGC